MSAAQAQAQKPERDRGVIADRRFAAGLLAFIVLVFTPVGARMSLRRAVKNVEEQFFTGVGSSGAAADFLEDAKDAALGLVTVGAKYDAAAGETGELRVDRGILLDALEGGDIAEIASANALCISSFNALRDKLLTLELSEQDADALKDYGDAFDGAQGAVSRAGYNEEAAEFIADTYERFPASLIGSALGVDPPAVFK